jgi:protein-S-isoprenylcysteine O-methyltransferase Ste14
MAQPAFLFLNTGAQSAYLAVLGIHWISEMLILRKVGPNRAEDRGSFRVLRIVLPLAWLAGIAGTRIPQPTFGSPFVFYCGLTLMIVGELLRWWSVATLGRFFTVNVSILEGHRVVDSGPYSLVRHPSYAAILLIYFGAGLCLGNAFSLSRAGSQVLGIKEGLALDGRGAALSEDVDRELRTGLPVFCAHVG